VLLIGDHAADRLRVAEVAVSAENTAGNAADAHAAPHLRDSALVMLAEDFEVCHDRSSRLYIGSGVRKQASGNRIPDS
jgi:hypothetical protein